jgi:hypothetical protein
MAVPSFPARRAVAGDGVRGKAPWYWVCSRSGHKSLKPALFPRKPIYGSILLIKRGLAMVRIFLGIFLTLAVIAPARAQTRVVTTCDLGRGHVVSVDTVDGSLTWYEDGFTNGNLTLMETPGGIDLIVRDAVATNSVRELGGEVLRLDSVTEGQFIVNVIYPSGPTVEAYTFSLDALGSGTVIWTQTRPGFLLPGKAAAFAGRCSKAN